MNERELIDTIEGFLQERGWRYVEYQIVRDPTLRGNAWVKGEPRAGGPSFIGLLSALTAELRGAP